MAIITHRGASSRIARFSSTQQQPTTRKEIKQPYFLPPPSPSYHSGGGSSYTHTHTIAGRRLFFLSRSKGVAPFCVCVCVKTSTAPLKNQKISIRRGSYIEICVYNNNSVCVWYDGRERSIQRATTTIAKRGGGSYWGFSYSYSIHRAWTLLFNSSRKTRERRR